MKPMKALGNENPKNVHVCLCRQALTNFQRPYLSVKVLLLENKQQLKMS